MAPGTMQSNAGILKIVVTIKPSPCGQVLLAIFNSVETWMNMEHIDYKMALPYPKEGIAIFEIDELPSGTYACCVLVDSNFNNQMDFNIAGYPLEDFAFSNQAKGNFGPPSFEAASFTHTREIGTVLEIAID